MQRTILFLSILIFGSMAYAQKIDTHHINPDSSNYPNVYVKLIHTDSAQSTYMIWVKNWVLPHYHAHHTEYIQVLSGRGRMTLDSSTFTIRKGDVIVIPKGSVHSVKTLSRHALKVMSVQAPKFDGDRIWINKPKETVSSNKK
ncbi:MAG: cupin domain-containing protein [Bacteroidia bacterium]